MHLVTYSEGQAAMLGVLHGDKVVPLGQEGGPATMRELIESGPDEWERTRQAAESRREDGDGDGVPLSSVQLLAPISNPSKIVAIGLNYMDHCREQNVEPPKQPLLFTKFPSAIVGPGGDIVWDQQTVNQVDYEVELCVVIGRRARNVSRGEALDYVFGYTILNDVSAREIQFSDGQWVRGKSLDTFCPLGPAIVTADEIRDPQALALRCLVNGTPLQDSTTAEMIFSVAELIEFVSRFITLEPGDLLATGTPYGVGVFRDPKVFLNDGDEVVLEIEKIGRLENRCRAVSG